MKRGLTLVALLAFAASPAAAQFMGMPNWNSPKGGTGVTLSADVGMPSDDFGSGTAYGARASIGLANLTITGGFTSWGPDGAPDNFSSFGGSAAFRVIGGSLLPIALNLQVGAARTGEANSLPGLTRLTTGAGISASVPTPLVSIEPYLSLSNRWYMYEGFDTESNFGWTLGANLSLGGMFGVHLAYDSESGDGDSIGVFGIGAHVALRVPLGM